MRSKKQNFHHKDTKTQRKTYVPLCVFVSWWLVLMFFRVSPALASGVLIDTKGKVNVAMPGGKNITAKTGVELPDGTKVSVANGASAAVMLMDGSIAEIGSGQSYTLGGDSKPSEKRTVIDGIALAMNEATAQTSGPTVHGMVKMGQVGPGAPKPTGSLAGLLGPQAVFPSRTTLEMQPQITFRWSGKFKFPNPAIVIEDALQKRIAVKKISPEKPQITIRAEELKLAAGNNYGWYFASDENGKVSAKSRRVNFAIISAAEKNKLDEDKNRIRAMNLSEDGKKFLTAQIYFRANMFDSMVKELLPLWQKDRTDAVKKLLYLGYARMGQAEEVQKYQ